MGESSIQWTDYTFNPWIGCTKVSPGCKHCYAERTIIQRSNWGVKWGLKGNRKRTSPSNWKAPLKWNRLAHAAGKRRRVFCCSLADVFEDRPELVPMRNDLFELIRITPHLDWLLLTKRPENISSMLPADWGSGWENVWLGCSTEDQTWYDRRIEALLAVPARIHFLSAEPLIGPITLAHGKAQRLDWIIVGGESGPGFRPMNLQWARQLRDDSAQLDVCFFFKQHSGLHPKALGNQLDGRSHLNWPGSPHRSRGRPKVSHLSRSEQLQIAQQKHRKKFIYLPLSREQVEQIDQKVGISGRNKFLATALRRALK
jgi:protein gp37